MYQYAKDHKLDLEEFSGLLSIGLCKAAMNYNSEKGKFSTIAYTCMRNEVGHYLRKVNAIKYMKDEDLCSYDALEEDCDNKSGNLKSFILVSHEHLEDDYMFRAKFRKEFNKLKDKPKNIIRLRYHGYKNGEIAKIMDMKESTVSMAVRKFRRALA